MFLKTKPIQVIDDCVMHRDVHHDFEFIAYLPLEEQKERIVIRLRCVTCEKAKLNNWDYYRVSSEYWLGFLLEHSQIDFTSAN